LFADTKLQILFYVRTSLDLVPLGNVSPWHLWQRPTLQNTQRGGLSAVLILSGIFISANRGRHSTIRNHFEHKFELAKLWFEKRDARSNFYDSFRSASFSHSNPNYGDKVSVYSFDAEWRSGTNKPPFKRPEWWNGNFRQHNVEM